MADKTIHQGRNIKRFRDMLGIKQDALADALGDDWSQKKVSLLEAKETIEPAVLEQVAKVLKLPVEAIENFDEQAAINIISGSLHDESVAHANNYKCIFNPLDELLKMVEENKRMVDENRKLYVALLKEKDEKIALLEKLLDKK